MLQTDFIGVCLSRVSKQLGRSGSGISNSMFGVGFQVYCSSLNSRILRLIISFIESLEEIIMCIVQEFGYILLLMNV